MINGIHHIALHTADLDRKAAFYQRAFGFQPIGEVYAWAESAEVDATIGVPNSAARTLMMRAGNCCIELFEYSQPAPNVTAPLRPNDHGYTHFAVDVTDLTSEMTRLREIGMTFASPEPMIADGIKAIYGYDPDGHIIELQELAADHPFRLNNLTGR